MESEMHRNLLAASALPPRVLIRTTEDLKEWSMHQVLEQRKLRATREHVLAMLADVSTDPAMGDVLNRAAARADERRFTGETITGFGALA
jgi:hypothetical protein